MLLEDIREKWTSSRGGDRDAEIAAWDSVADSYERDESVSFATDPFLQFMQEKVELSLDMDVLDVGCGAGAYACEVAKRVHQVTGVDFSKRMIAAAHGRSQRKGVENVLFEECDWQRCDEEAYRGKYDVVFAHTTPAVADYETLMKLMRASRRYCFFCMPARRKDEVLDALRKIAGIEKRNQDVSAAYAFDTVWLNGFDPEIRYTKTVWKSSRSVSQAEQWYLGRLNGARQLGDDQQKKVREYLASIAIEGQVNETIHTTLVSFFWQVV